VLEAVREDGRERGQEEEERFVRFTLPTSSDLDGRYVVSSRALVPYIEF